MKILFLKPKLLLPSGSSLALFKAAEKSIYERQLAVCNAVDRLLKFVDGSKLVSTVDVKVAPNLKDTRVILSGLMPSEKVLIVAPSEIAVRRRKFYTRLSKPVDVSPEQPNDCVFLRVDNALALKASDNLRILHLEDPSREFGSYKLSALGIRSFANMPGLHDDSAAALDPMLTEFPDRNTMLGFKSFLEALAKL